MANYVKFYTVAILNESDEVTDRSILTFFKKIEAVLESDESKTIRQIAGNTLRLFSYYWNATNDDLVVIPVGKLKDKNIPYGVDINDPKKLAQIPSKLYDVNSLVYHKRFNVLVITTNQQGPSSEIVQEYLNTFLNKNDGYKVKIQPILYNTGIAKLRGARQVKSITFALELCDSLNSLYVDRINEINPLGKAFRNLVSTSKDVANSKRIYFTMNVGSDRNGTLDKDSLLSLLNAINIESECVKEIFLNYKDDSNDKVEIAKIKNYTSVLLGKFSIGGTQLAPEYLRENAEQVITSKSNEFRIHIRDYFTNFREDDDEYNVISEWGEMER